MTIESTAEEQPVPDELCPHIELGAVQAGGVFFETPGVSVGMCQSCLDQCQHDFETLRPMLKSEIDKY